MSSHRSLRLSFETLEARLVPSATVLDLTARGAVATAPSGAIVEQAGNTPSHGQHGHSALNTFLRLDDNGIEQGYNSGARRHQFDEEYGTQSLTLGRVPVVSVDGVAYREFLLNVNQEWWSPNISLDELRIYLGNSGNLSGYNVKTKQLAGMNAAFDLDAGGDVSIKVRDRSNRCNGSEDMVLLIPDAAFAGASAGTFVYLYSKFGGLHGAGANGGAEEWSVRCNPTPAPAPSPAGGSISGFVQLVAGDYNPDPALNQGTLIQGIANVTVLLFDANGNPVLDSKGEQVAATTDSTGFYQFKGLAAGTYSIMEVEPVSSQGQRLYADGTDFVGTIVGTTDPSLWGHQDIGNQNDLFVDIQLGTGQQAVNYDFTELLSDNV